MAGVSTSKTLPSKCAQSAWLVKAALEAPQAPAERCLTVEIAAAPEVLCATVATFLRAL